MKSNQRDDFCAVCRRSVRAGEGLVHYDPDVRRYSILCAEHAPAGLLAPPKPPAASKLPSIHLGDEKYER